MNPAHAALAAVCLSLTAPQAWAAAPPGPASSALPGVSGPIVASSAPATATDREAPPLRYTVRPGDTLAAIGARALAEPDDWRGLARRNEIKDPDRLVPGSTILIPADLLRREPVDATVVAFSGTVKIEGEKAALGRTVLVGDVIATGPNSFITLAMSDGSRVTLPSQSRIRIEALHRVALDGRLERRFRLEKGRGDFTVAPKQQPDDRFLVRTPVAVAAVRGTEFDIDTDSDESIITVDEGVVSSRPEDEDQESLLTAGHAAMLDSDDSRRVTMLPRPVLTPESNVGAGTADLTMVIAPDTAVSHHVVLARDAGFVDQFAEADTSTRQLSFANIADGIIYARVRGVDAEGVAGLAADYSAVRGPPPPIRATHFRWQRAEPGDRRYDLVVARDAALADRAIDIEGLDATEFVAEGLAAGVWYWRVIGRPADGTSGRVHVHPIRLLTIVPPRRDTLVRDTPRSDTPRSDAGRL